MLDKNVEFVVNTFAELVGADGGALKFVALEGKTLKVRYAEGKNDECPDCVISARQLEELMSESLKVHAPYVTGVEIVP